MANPYTTQTISGYNQSAPPDDGSQVAANQLNWSKHKDKLADPIKTLAENINTAVNSAFATVDDASNLTTGELPDARLSANVLVASDIGGSVQAWDVNLDQIAALAVTNSNFIVGNGSAWVAENATTARTSLGVGTGNSPQFNAVNIGHATDTTLSRSAAGDLAVEGREIFAHDDGSLTSARVHVSTSGPSGGANGDVWLEREA